MKNLTFKRILAALLTLCLTLSLLPAGVPAHAATHPSPARSSVASEINGSFVVELLDDGMWSVVAEFDADMYSRDYAVDLSKYDDPTLRVSKRADGMAILDAVLLGGAPADTMGDNGVYTRKKLSASDLDVLELTDSMEFMFSGSGTLVITGRIENEVLPNRPFYRDVERSGHDILSALAPYNFTRTGTITIDGVPDALDSDDAFRVYETISGSGHPDGFACIWVYNDGEYLYAALDWTGDNTYDYGNDFFKVYADDGTVVREFSQWSDRGDYGAWAFTYTDKASYQHMYYEMAIPLHELGGTSNLMLGFAMYGTSYEPRYSGTITEINNIDDLIDFRDEVNSGDYTYYDMTVVLKTDIDLTEYLSDEDGGYNGGEGWKPIGYGNSTSGFDGTFDGRGHTISGLIIDRNYDNCQGLFSSVTYDGTVKNLNVSGSINSTCYVGGIVGMNDGMVSGCSFSGSVSGTEYSVGGVVGANYGNVKNSYNTGDVSGEYSVGGVVGENYSYIVNVYNTGDVTGTTAVGGVVGDNSDYGYVEYSYWNTEATVTNGLGIGIDESSGDVYGKTLTEMQHDDFRDLLNENKYDDSIEWRRDNDTNSKLPYIYLHKYWHIDGAATVPYEVGGVITITTPGQLGGVAAALQKDEYAFNGKTIKLNNNIALDGMRWYPVNAKGIVFDGCGHTISGLNVVDSVEDTSIYGSYSVYCSGFFGLLEDSMVINITFSSPTVNIEKNNFNYQNTAGVIAGSSFGSEIYKILLVNPVVNLSTTSSSDGLYAGGIVGYAGEGQHIINHISGADIHGGSVTITANNYVSNALCVGGVVGANASSLVISSAVYNTKVILVVDDSVSLPDETDVGGIAGYTSGVRIAGYGTCLLNNLSMADMTVTYNGAETINKGMLAGHVDDDNVVNNLYLGTESDKWGKLTEEVDLVTSPNYGITSAVDVDSTLLNNLNDTTVDGGFYAAALVIIGDSQEDVNIDEALAKLRVWETWASGNAYGYAEGTPKLGAYYPLPTYWHDEGAAGSYSTPVDHVEHVVTITNAEELGLFASELMVDPTKYDMYTVNLAGDDADAFDMSDHRWMPVDMAGVEFMGNNNTISNLRVKDYTEYGAHPDYYFITSNTAGMFGTLDRCRVNDLTLKNPIVEISGRSSYNSLYIVGALAGQMLGAKLLNVVIENPTVSNNQANDGIGYYDFYMLGGVTGYAQPYARSKYTVIYDFDNDPINFSVIRGVDVHGGEVSLTLYDDGEAVYMGGIAGANFNSVIASSSANYTELSIDSTDVSSSLWAGYIGGITGYTSSEHEAYTCLLNNLSMATIAEVPDNIYITNKYIGGIAGMVDEDSVVNNLYIGNLEMLGSLNVGDYTVSNNHVYATITDAWGSNGAYIAMLNDDTVETGGFYKAASILSEDSQGDHGIEEALTMFRVWETYPDNSNKYGYAAKTPYLGAYYTPATPITAAAITVTAPVIAVAPDTTASGAGNFTAGAVSWTPIVADKFLGGTQYTATVTLTAASGYTFTGISTGSNLTINGENATIVSNTGGTLTISYQFAATASQFYVSNNGNDTTGDGSSDKPFATIEKAYRAITGTTGEILVMDEITASELIELTVPDPASDTKTVTLKSASGTQTVKRGVEGHLFTISSGVTFILENITIDGNNGIEPYKTHSGGSLVIINYNGTLTMNGDATLQNNNGGGGVKNGGTFIMNSGTISGINGDGDNGVYNAGIFTMNGGKISGNTAIYEGGGVNSCNSGTFTMNGGEISGNTAGDSGGGVYVWNGKFIMNGGEISGNTASDIGGVDIVGGFGVVKFTVGGTAKIKDNTNSGGAASNVYLYDGKYITLGTGDNAPVSGESGMEIHINGTKTTDGVFVESGADATIKGYFHTDDATKEIVLDGDILKLVAIQKYYVASNGSDTNTGTQASPFATIAKAYSVVPSGGEILVMDTITASALISLTGTKTVTLKSASGTQMIKRGVTGNLFTVGSGVTLIVESITIDGGNQVIGGAYENFGGGGSLVMVDSGGALTMNNGATLQNNSTTESGCGGGVYNKGAFTMNSGEIKGNISSSGGGVHNSYGTFIMSSGIISGNTGNYGGGGVYNYFHEGSGTFTVGGSAKITNNTKSGAPNNVYLYSEQYITLGTGDNGAPAPVDDMEIHVQGASGATIVESDATEDHVQYFKADDSTLEVVHDGGALKLATALTPVTSASITVTAPVLDAAPVTTAPSGVTGYTCGTVSWTPTDNPFKGGTQYTATVTLTADSGYTFTGLATATINGNTATVTNNTGSAVTLSYQFAVTALAAVTNTPSDKSITYSGNTYDVSQLFTIDTNAGTAAYTIETGGTGTAALVGNTLTITKAGTINIGLATAATTTHAAGTLVTATLTVSKGSQTAPNAPVLDSKTEKTVTLTATSSMQFSKDGIDWQDSNVFGGLTAGAEYTFYQRLKATDLFNMSNVSPALSVTVPFKVVVIDYPANNGDSVTGNTVYQNVGDTVTITYTLSSGALVNTLSLGHGITITNTAASNYNYTVNASHATNGVITLTPVFTHQSTLSSGTVTITAPVKGQAPSATATGDGSGNYTATASWNGNPSVFAGGTAYTVTVTLTAQGGATFDSGFTLTINGNTATKDSVSSGTAVFTYTFPALSAKEASSISVITQPTTTVYYSGDTLDLSGLVVTATYDDGTTGTVTPTGYSIDGTAVTPGTTLLTNTAHNSKPVTVTYGGKSASTSNLTVKLPPSINNITVTDIASTGAKVSYTATIGTEAITSNTLEYKTGGTWQTATNGTPITGLSANTLYDYRITVSDGTKIVTHNGSFQTAPLVSSGVTVSGTVTDSTTPANITVTLEHGNTVIASVTVSGSGTYTFSFNNIKNGVYNLVADNGSYKVTQAVTVSGSNVTTATINMDLASGKTQSIVDIVSNDTPPAAVGGLPALFSVPALYTAADQAVVSGNGTVEMKLAVEKQTAPSDAGAINTAAGSTQEIGLFLDISVIKSHYTDQGELIHDEKLPDLGASNFLTITFELPSALSGKTITAIYRAHDDAVNTLTKNSTADEYFEQNGNIITLYVHKFSTYALAIAKDTGGGNTGGNGGGNNGGNGSNSGSAGGNEETETSVINSTIITDFDDKDVKIGTNGRYASYTVEITAERAKKITTAVVTEQDGTQRHVPTYVFSEGGKWYATVYSMTDSYYEFIYNELSFSDAKGKWYESTVNEMASRKIISGIGNNQFAGERDITRAEFAAIVIRALGLPSDGDGTIFSDVPANAWYCGAVGKAYEYGIVAGVGNGKFAPDVKITRQEAMEMIQRMAEIVGFKGTTGSIDAFPDAGSVSDWALAAAQWNVGSGLVVGSNGMLRPLDNITRAETATLVLKLLQKAGLVDVRTPLTTAQTADSALPIAYVPRKEPELAILPDDSDDETAKS